MRAKVALAVVSPLLFALPAQAALLGLTLQNPDIASGFIDVEYNALTDSFSATGFALNINVPPASNISGGAFSISATIDSSGVATSGSLNISGGVFSLGPSLLTGTLTAFGYQDGGGDLFEFLFTIDGGALATPAYYGNPGNTVGVIMDANFGSGGFAGNWSASFNNNGGQPGFGQGVSDTGSIPGPGALTALLGSCLFIARRRRHL